MLHMQIQWLDLGTAPYDRTWALQEELRKRRISGNVCDFILLAEHPPIITLGRRQCQGDILSSKSLLIDSGIDVVQTNRGGRATYHGPGQLVCYFICELRSFGMGVRDFVNAIEEICILTLEQFGIKSERDDKHPGLWIGNKKIAAIGLNVSRGVTQHGFALNVDCDLSAYRHIIACGIKGRGVTSMARQLMNVPEMNEVKRCVLDHAGRVLKRDMAAYVT